MASISSSTGVVSGINYATIIDQLMKLESTPKTLLQSRIDATNKQKLAYADIQTRLTTLRFGATALKKPSTFQNSVANSSNQDVLTANAATGTTPGSYQFQVARLVSTQQSVSTGFADFDKTKVGSSTLTLTAGDGKLSRAAKLYQLNGGTGIGAGTFTITDRAGATADIATGGLANLDDLIKRINDAGVDVTASIGREGLVLTDNSGGTGNLIVTDGTDGQQAATKLGIAQSVAGNVLTGSDINSVGAATKVQDLNDGRGVRTGAGNDFRIALQDGTNIDVNLTTLNTVQDVLTAINSASGNGGKVVASVDNQSNGLILTDTSGGASFTVSALNGSKAADDLGLTGTASTTMNGKAILAPLNTAFLSSLKGGAGLALGQFDITNKAGAVTSVDLTGSVTVQDVLDKINTAGAGAGITAALSTAGNGIQLVDASSGSGSITVADTGGGTTANQLGIAGTFAGTTVVTGTNLGLAKVSAGTLVVEQGGGELNTPTLLSQLNGGNGVKRGSFRVTDRTGKSAVIDVSSAVSLDDVLKKINNNLDLDIRAEATKDGVKITDRSGGAGKLTITDLAGGSTAKDLGIAGSVTADTLTGTSVLKLGANTTLSQLNDGRGIRKATSGGDFTIKFSDNSTLDVDLSAAKTVGDIVKTINDAGGTKFKAEISGNAIKLTDTSGLGGTFSVTSTNGSKAAEDLGLVTTGAAGSVTGANTLGGVNTVMLASLKGGAGLATGTFTLQNRTGASASIDFTGATTVQDVLDRINAATDGASNPLGVTASLNSAGTGIQLTDGTGGSGDLVITDTAGTLAADLGLAGTYDTSAASVVGTNLQRKFISENTALADYNFGKGVNLGSFKMTNAAGQTTTIDLRTGTYTSLNDVIKKINAATTAGNPPAAFGVTASINANGDGLLLTDTTVGGSKLKIEDVSGTAAADLQIAGTATTNTIDGTLEKHVDLAVDDTLATVQTKLNNLNFGVRASIINDGTGASPYRLSLTAVNSGYAGRVTFDAGTSLLNTTKLVEAQDAAVFVGSSTATQPLLITAKQNQISGIIPGLTVNLNGVSSNPVTVNVSNTPDKAIDQMKTFVDSFNSLIDKVAEYTKWDTTTNKGGILLGDGTVQGVQQTIYVALNTVVSTAGKFRVAADVGLKLTDGAKLTFDEDKFRQAASSDPTSIEKLFTSFTTVTGSDGKTTSKAIGVMARFEEQINKLIDPVNGTVIRQNKTLDDKTNGFDSRIKQLDALLTQKRTRLTTQFATLESTLAKLQSQQSSLGSLASIATSTK
jgi:flagellar hook-associated protein 2